MCRVSYMATLAPPAGIPKVSEWCIIRPIGQIGKRWRLIASDHGNRLSEVIAQSAPSGQLCADSIQLHSCLIGKLGFP